MKVTLLEACASDLNVVNAARVSFAQESAAMDAGGAGLIRFLMRERHGTPFEHGYFRFHVEAPIFVFREWQRHRVGHSFNEMSGRYVEMEDRFYTPKTFRGQIGKPGAYTYFDIQDPNCRDTCSRTMDDAYEASWSAYQALLAEGIAKEQARAVLPLGIYSQMHWTCNPRSLMHFLGLRNAPNAQQEIRECAAQAESALAKHMPVTYAAFIANERTAP